ncbi:glutathione S-transferase family protein [Cystobacter fuscus]|uniref:glutathione S-transferase family protein n=1 Tax=Cystobacter fuscus TaxID=43 RepID=UPI0026AB000F
MGTSPFLVGPQLTLADISLCTALGIWRGALGRTMPDTLSAYWERLQARPAYQRAMQANT